MDLDVELEQEEDGRWIGSVPELPGMLAYGETRDEAMTAAQTLAERVIADRIEHGEDDEPISLQPPSRRPPARRSPLASRRALAASAATVGRSLTAFTEVSVRPAGAPAGGLERPEPQAEGCDDSQVPLPCGATLAPVARRRLLSQGPPHPRKRQWTQKSVER